MQSEEKLREQLNEAIKDRKEIHDDYISGRLDFSSAAQMLNGIDTKIETLKKILEVGDA